MEGQGQRDEGRLLISHGPTNSAKRKLSYLTQTLRLWARLGPRSPGGGGGEEDLSPSTVPSLVGPRRRSADPSNLEGCKSQHRLEFGASLREGPGWGSPLPREGGSLGTQGAF